MLPVERGAGVGLNFRLTSLYWVLQVGTTKGKSLGGVQITKYTLDMLSSFQKL